MQTYDFIPVDTIFCRDSRPLAAGAGFGRGANWPLPNTLHEALRAALLRAASLDLFSGKQQQVVKIKNGRRIERKVGTSALDWLHLNGPFPVDKDGITWFPTPRDLMLDENRASRNLKEIRRHCLLPAREGLACSNLPDGLPFLVASNARATKEELPRWMPAGLYKSYLAGSPLQPWKAQPLWDTEHRLGIEIAPDTHSTVESKIYAAEHLRLRDDIRLRFAVNAPTGHQRSAERNKTVADLVGSALTLGGERRFGQVEEAPTDLILPDVSGQLSDVFIKWVLLTPAIFAHGWRPGWIGMQNGRAEVRLTVFPEPKAYMQYSTREDRRSAMQAAAKPIQVRLIGACVGKAQPIAGWDLLQEGTDKLGNPTMGAAKPTCLAVPSGSVFYFQADKNSVGALVKALQGRCRSDFFGEKGLGLGVCGEVPRDQAPQSS